MLTSSRTEHCLLRPLAKTMGHHDAVLLQALEKLCIFMGTQQTQCHIGATCKQTKEIGRADYVESVSASSLQSTLADCRLLAGCTGSCHDA